MNTLEVYHTRMCIHTCVVLPHPVSPPTTTTSFSFIFESSWSFTAAIGRAARDFSIACPSSASKTVTPLRVADLILQNLDKQYMDATPKMVTLRDSHWNTQLPTLDVHKRIGNTHSVTAKLSRNLKMDTPGTVDTWMFYLQFLNDSFFRETW